VNTVGNPNHDPKTGQFSSGPGGAGSHVNGGAHTLHRSLGTKVLHGAKVAAKVAAVGALAVGGILLAHGISEKIDNEHYKNFTRNVRDRYLKNLGEAAAESFSSRHTQSDYMAQRQAFEDEQLKRTQEEFVKPAKTKTSKTTGPKMPRAANIPETPKKPRASRSKSRK
jgi:hypothetical protein